MGWPIPHLPQLPAGVAVAQAAVVEQMSSFVDAHLHGADGLPDLDDALSRAADGTLSGQGPDAQARARELTKGALVALEKTLSALEPGSGGGGGNRFQGLRRCVRDTPTGVEVGWVHDLNADEWAAAGSGGADASDNYNADGPDKNSSGTSAGSSRGPADTAGTDSASSSNIAGGDNSLQQQQQFEFTAQKRGRLNTAFKQRLVVAYPEQRRLVYWRDASEARGTIEVESIRTDDDGDDASGSKANLHVVSSGREYHFKVADAETRRRLVASFN